MGAPGTEPLALGLTFAYARGLRSPTLPEKVSTMTRLRLLALLLSLPFGALAFSPSVALADDPEPEVSDQVEEPAGPDPMHLRWDRLLGLELTGGIDSPYGVVGAGILVSPLRFLRIDLGGGVSRDGARLAGGVSVVLPQDHFALVLRVGASGGPLTWDGDYAADPAAGSPTQTPVIAHQHRYWGFAAFFDTSIGLEYRFDEGVLLRLSAGIETTLNDTADACASDGGACLGTVHDHPARIWGALSVGYMFDIYP